MFEYLRESEIQRRYIAVLQAEFSLALPRSVSFEMPESRLVTWNFPGDLRVPHDAVSVRDFSAQSSILSAPAFRAKADSDSTDIWCEHEEV